MDFIEKFIDFIISMVAKIRELVSSVQGIVKGETEFNGPEGGTGVLGPDDGITATTAG